jgi:threonine dehydratase
LRDGPRPHSGSEAAARGSPAPHASGLLCTTQPGDGRRTWLKLKTRQPTGSFKVRQALTGALVNLEEARRNGVLASSSGNFAQAVAYAGRELGLDAQIVMMSKSPFISRFRFGSVRKCGGIGQNAVVPR